MGAEESHHCKPNYSENGNTALARSKFQNDHINFFVNGREYSVNTNGCDPDIGPNYVLVDYLRDKLGLTGTKFMCREGGCGACIVTAKSYHPGTGEDFIGSVNSCLLPLYACDGLDITTIEALGNRRDGYDQIQESLVRFGGTQCGFCSPGFVMNMHSLALANPKFKQEDVEYSFDGNICRCTGFRPIMDAFKALSVNSSEELKRKCVDIEELVSCPRRRKSVKDDLEGNLEIVRIPRNLYLQSPVGEHWAKVITIENLFDTLQMFVSARVHYRFVAGNTGTGVYKNDGPYQGFIEINDVPELKHSSIDDNGITLGGNVTITAAIDVFSKASKIPKFVYALEFVHHLRRVACISVRNRGTLAGNLMLKHMHREFYSDVFLLFETVGAKIQIGSSTTLQENFSLAEFLKVDMTGKVILSIHLPSYTGDFVFRSVKVGKRYQNASAYVNAAFLFDFDPNSLTVLSRPTICFGGINPKFIHAYQTEQYLEGKQLNSVVLRKAMTYLQHEAIPDIAPQSASPEYRLGLAQSFLYKFLLQIVGNNVVPRLRSGAYEIERQINSSQQVFETDKSKWPLSQPIPKIESYQQVSGEAQYINDIREELDELHGVFVVTSVGNASIKSIDASQAKRIPGVVDFYTARNIPGANNFATFLQEAEEVFVERTVKYAGQPVGLLVARSRQIALEARRKVTIQYDNMQPPVVDIAEAVKNKHKDSTPVKEIEKLNISFPCKGRGLSKKMTSAIIENITAKLESNDQNRYDGEDLVCTEENALLKLKGEFQTHAQYHFHMETQTCICVPNESGMDVWSSAQSMEVVQAAVATALNVSYNSLTLNVRRLGGAFGAKSSRAAHVASACAVAAYHTHKPVRVVMDLETNMQMIGKRLPYLVKYEVVADKNGKIYKLESNIYCDTGSSPNEPTSLYGMICSQSCYRAKDWNVTPGLVTTNTATNTFCRAPGSSQGVAIIETIMEHIAFAVKRIPLEVRAANFIRKGDPLLGIPGAELVLDNPLPRLIDELKDSCDYDTRKNYIDDFNLSNRWKKRGISIVPQRYPNYYWDFRFPTFISVYHVDGSVNVSHAGIEMGQGINTKVAQVVAYTLQIPLDKVKIQPSNNIISPNTAISGGSVASELVCSSARRACIQLLERLEPVRKALKNPTWEELIAAAQAREILLTSHFQEATGDVVSYDIWGVACIEVEVDVLTGDYKIVRSDIIEDAGESMSPLVDIGQIEGAFVMGLGWWLTEELIYDKSTGELLTDNTWSYKPMLPADIPEDFRVTILSNAPNPFGVLSSKATAEPPLNLSVCAIFALRHAIDSARRDAGDESWYQMDGPVTREKVWKLSLSTASNFTFK